MTDNKIIILSCLLLLSLTTSCTSGIDAIDDAHDAYRIYNSLDSTQEAASTPPENLTNTNQVIITGLDPGDPRTPRGWGALVISIDGIKVNGTGDTASILPGEHTLEIECYSPGRKTISRKVTKTFQINRKYIISASGTSASCEILLLS